MSRSEKIATTLVLILVYGAACALVLSFWRSR